MNTFPPALLSALALAAALGLGSCGDAPHSPADHAHDAHDADHDHGAESGGHRHEAPRGGTLVELEHEGANLELVLDDTTGTLTAYVLDGCCEKPVRIPQETIQLQIVAGGTAFRLDLAAQERAMTGEKKGDTSEFAAQHDRLRGTASFKGVVEDVRIAGRSFQGVKFEYARKPK